MKNRTHSLSAVKSLAVLLLLSIFSIVPAISQAAAILTLSGDTGDVKYETDSGIRISLIDWSADDQRMAVEDAWRQYRQDNDLDTFLSTVDAQDTRGYLFTAASTGYRIKYAWKEETSDGQMLHFLVTPGLKTRNPYMWDSPNNDSPEFTLVQVNFDQETGIAKTSLDGDIALNEQGRLALDRFDSVKMFANLKDSTPYYLKQ